MSRRLSSLLVALLTASGVLAAGESGSAATHASTSAVSSQGSGVTVGAVRLTSCDLTDDPTWCGSVPVPLDRTDGSAGSITVGFGWVPASGRATGTVVAMEGGPGYPSTGTAQDYVDMLGSLHRSRNLLVVDARGTGTSALIRCHTLQTFTGNTATAHFRSLVAACGRQLNHTYRRSDGTYVHASDLFGTANVARDLADVLGRLQLRGVDLYGDSYGTYFAQSFLSRYPALLRSVVLDSAYEARDLDPWYVTTATTARRAFEVACTRSRACDHSAGSGAWHRIALLAKALRAHPVHGRVPGTDGRLTPTTVGIRELVDLVNDAGYDYGVYRSLDAAGRAWRRHGDARPLLRLYAEDFGYDDSDYYGPAASYSDGDFYAVGCTDYPQLFDPRTTPAQRRRQLAASVKALPARTFAPFTTAEWMSMDAYTEAYSACLDWPNPTHAADAPVPPGPMDASGVPVLVLNGDLDSLTPGVGGAHVARQIGPAARSVLVPNMVHLVALDDRYGCGDSIYMAFVRHPGRLASLDTSCAATVPEVHTVGALHRHLSRMRPATVSHGHATRTQRRLAAVLVAAAGDAAYRFQYTDDEAHDLGLRGGKVHYALGDDGDTVTTRLHGDRWTVDTAVSGTFTTDYYGLGVHGTLRVHDSHGHHLTGRVRWSTDGRHTRGTVTTATATFRLPAP